MATNETNSVALICSVESQMESWKRKYWGFVTFVCKNRSCSIFGLMDKVMEVHICW